MSPRPPWGLKLFLTSAKTGVGVSDAFADIAQHVVTRWEWEQMRAEPPNGMKKGSMVGVDQANDCSKEEVFTVLREAGRRTSGQTQSYHDYLCQPFFPG
jgi:hypothetical protein